MKIRVTDKVKEIEGQIIERVVTPFGTSAHIPFSKQHVGKIVSVIVPEESEYTWVLSKKELDEVIKASDKVLKSQKESRLTFFKRGCINHLKDKIFSYDDLIKVLGILEESKNYKVLAEKIRKTYSL
jgi:putative transposon-encoded protein